MTQRVFLTAGLSIVLVFCSLTSQAEMYRWTDESGNVHFSDKPHANAERMQIRAPKSSGIGTGQRDKQKLKALSKDLEYNRLKRQKQAQKEERQRAAQERKCVRLKNQLKNYQEVDYLFYRDDSGKKIRLSGEQKRQKQQELREQIANDC